MISLSEYVMPMWPVEKSHSSFAEFQLRQVKTQLQIQYLQLSGRQLEESPTASQNSLCQNCGINIQNANSHI